MPELPDLEYIVEHLRPALKGESIGEVKVKQPIVIRNLAGGSFEETLMGREVLEIVRTGPFVDFQLNGDLHLVMHAMLAGRFALDPKVKKTGLCFTLKTEQALLTFLDTKKMAKVYLAFKKDLGKIPRFLEQGPNILDEAFTREVFEKIMGKNRKQVRVFIMDQTKLSAVGNAYADEILFEAGIHPKTTCNQLDQGEREKLFLAVKGVMAWGIDQVRAAGRPIEEKVREHVRVRNRKDEPCPRCETRIRRASVLGHDAFFCPTCQPPKRGQFIDWSTVKKKDNA